MAEALSETKDSQKGSVRKVGALGENKGKKFARKFGINKGTQSSEGDAAKKSNTLISVTSNEFKEKESTDKSSENGKKKSLLDLGKDNLKKSRIIKAIKSKSLKSLEKCFDQGFLNSSTKINGEKPILIAAKLGFDEGSLFLVKKLGWDGCIDVNEDGDTISTWAIKNNKEGLIASIDPIELRLAKGDTNFHYGEIYRMIRDSRYSSETIERVIHDSNVLKQDVKDLNGSNHLVFDAINSRGGKVVKALMKKGINLDPEYKKCMNFKDICECFKDDKHEIKKWLKYKQEYLDLSSVKLSDLEGSFGEKVGKDLYYSTPGLPSYDYKYVKEKRNLMIKEEQKKRESERVSEKKKFKKFMANLMELNANNNAVFNSLPTPEALDNKLGLKPLQSEPIFELPQLTSSPKSELPTLPDLDINSLQFSADDMAGYDSIIGNSDGRLDIPDVDFNADGESLYFSDVKDIKADKFTTDGVDPFNASSNDDKKTSHKKHQIEDDYKLSDVGLIPRYSFPKFNMEDDPKLNIEDDYKLSDAGLIQGSSFSNFNKENDNFMELKDTSLQSFDDNLNLVDKGGLESNIALFPQPSIPKINTENNFPKLKANLKAK